MGKRIIAVAVVVASACTALQYSTTSQSSVQVDKDKYEFGSAGTERFTISPRGFADHDILQSIELVNCNSQWRLDTSLDVQQPVNGANVCNLGGPGSETTFLTNGKGTCPANYVFAVSYSATQPGISSCYVEIRTVAALGSAAELYTVQLSGVGSAATGISVSQRNIQFGEIPVQTTSSQQLVSVTNLGSGSAFVSATLDDSAFAVSPGSASIGPGSSYSFTTTCTPPTTGLHDGTLTFSAGSASATVGLTCTGINTQVNIQPAPVTFAKTLVGRPPGKMTVTISVGSGSGSGGSALIEDVSLDNAATAAGVTIESMVEGLPVGIGQDVVLAYSAAAVHDTGPLGSLSVKVSTDPNARTVAINGQALLGGVGTNPGLVDFGAVCVGDTAMESIEVYASEPGDIVVQQLTLPAAPFGAMAVDALPKTLAGNHAGPSVTVRATITPTAAGEFEDALALKSDVPNAGTTEVQLRGIALAAGIAATPDEVHFGTAALGSTTSIKEVQLTNCGTSPLSFERAQIVGADATEFSLIGTPAARVLQPTESETFMVVMQPASGGFKMAQLVLTHGEGTTNVDLDGTGDGDPASGKERLTYYACSTGQGAALWPIALALLALRRRRR